MVLTLDEIETRLHIHISCTSAEENLSSHIEDGHHLVDTDSLFVMRELSLQAKDYLMSAL